jgi:aldehyde dehydrogenase (NAD+)
MKLAQDAPLTGLHLAACLEEGGIPAGVFNVVVGRGSTVGTPLVEHGLVRAVSFTGSVAVGLQVRGEATALGKRVQLELGGHNPLIVTADADLGRAAEAAYAGAFWSAGQKCTATRRILVEEPVYDEFRTLLVARMERGVVGDPSDPATEVGPIVNESQLEEVLAGIDRGRADGGTLLAGGERLDDEAFLLAPTLFEGLADDAFLSCQEVFGPVASLYRFASLDDALRRANGVEYGLSASIFTSSLASARTFVQEIEAGIVRVNGQTAGADVHVPFGGVKSSGFGPHEQGRAAIEFYTELVTVYEDV